MKKNERIYQANFPKINDSPSFQKQKRKINMNRFIYNANKNHSLRDERLEVQFEIFKTHFYKKLVIFHKNFQKD